MPEPLQQISDPAPFDIDAYVDEWNSVNPIEEQADKRNAFASSLHKITRPFLAQGYNAAAALNRGLAGFSAHLDSVSDFISISTGMEKGGLFEKAAKTYEDNANYWRKRAEEVGIGFFDELISEAVGGFAPGVAQFSVDVASGLTLPYMAGAAEAAKREESPFVSGILEAAKTGVLAGLFRAMAPLKKYLQAPIMGTVFGIQEMEGAPQGEKAKKFAKGFGTGIGYSLATPGGRLGLNEIKKGIEPDLLAAKEMAEKGLEYSAKKLGEERGSLTGEEKRPRKFLKTVEEATETAPELKDALEDGILWTPTGRSGGKIGEKIPKDYIVQPNVESLAKADARIAASLSDTVDYVLSDASLTAEKGATFIQLMRKFEKDGDFDRAVEMTEAYDRQLREAGRFVQAASIWNKLSPQGFMRWANKQLDATRNKYSWMDTIFRNKPDSFRLTKEEQTEIFKRMTDIRAMPEGADKTDAMLELIDKIAQKVPPSVSELIDAYRYEDMLSSPMTQMRNISENIANTFVTRPADITLKGAIDFVQSSFTGKKRQAYVKDVATYMKSSINAVPNAANAFMSVWNLEQGVEIRKPEIGLDVKTEFDKARMKQMPGILTIVGRFMEASDKFNSALIGAGEFAVMKKRGATDAEAYARASALAEKYLYRAKLDPKDKDLSYFSQALSSLGKMVDGSRKLPVLGTMSKWYIPFIRTPINKGIQMIERSPLGIVRGEMSQETAAKILGGSIATAVGAMFALQGNTTWAPPTDPKEKEWFYASGRKPFSVKIGDKWVPFWYFGPFALAFGIPAAVKNYTVDQKQALTEGTMDKLLKISEGMAKFIGSQSSTQSIGAFFQAVSGDIDFTFPQTTAFTLEQFIPANGLVRYINTILDPVYRKPNSFMEQIEKDLPFLSNRLEARMTPLFETSKREMHNYFLPYDIGVEKPTYEGILPFKRHELRNQYLDNQMNKLIKDISEGRVTPEESFEKVQKILQGIPKSQVMFGNELLLKKEGEQK